MIFFPRVLFSPLALALLAVSALSSDAAVFNVNESGEWLDTIVWPGATIPAPFDEVWMNKADKTLTIPSDYTAQIDKLIVGRHALNTNLNVNGGTLLVGSGDNDVLFVGQYEDAEGTVSFNSGRVEVQGELAVAVSGKGTWIQDGGSVYVRDRFVIGRYKRGEAVGNVILRGGSIVADRFDMNTQSTLRLEGGLLELRGNHLSKVQGHIDAGRIVGSSTPKLSYEAESDVTSVWVPRVLNYNGAGAWSDTTVWPGATIPAPFDEVWMNKADKTLTIPSDYIAQIDKLIIGRHALNTNLNVNGGTLLVGSGDNDVLFVGQYEDAEGTVSFNSGRVEVQGELAVAVSGKGTWIQDGGSVYVRDRFVIGRYERGEAVGNVILRGGSIVADRFDMNTQSTLTLEGGIVALNGNHLSKVQGHVDAGRIVGLNGGPSPTVFYDADAGRTYAYSKITTLFTNYVGTNSWFQPSAWQPIDVPCPGSEIWMNSPATEATIGWNEVATANKLIIGRHVGPVILTVEDSAELLVGDGASTSAILFLGQYSNAQGNIIQNGGRIKVHGEFAIGVSGPGIFHMNDGRVDVNGRLVVGRYNNPSAVGSIVLEGGDIYTQSLKINQYSNVDLQGGRIFIDGNVINNILTYISLGLITSHGTPDVSVHYDQGTQHTVLFGDATRAPTTPSPTLFPTRSPTGSPTIAPVTAPPVTSFPTKSPTNTPTRIISPEDWDVRGILEFDHAKIGPRLPQINRNSLSIRKFTPAPEYGIHPRIFFGPDEIARVRASIENTTVGQAVYGGAKQIIALLVHGRNSCGGGCYNDISNEEKNLPNGKQKISNAGLYHTNPIYEDLISGSCSAVETQSGTHTNVLGGGMAIEAFDLLIFPDQVDADTRKSSLALAMSNWAECVMNNQAFVADGAHGTSAARDLFGGQHLAFAYDLAFNFMSTDQQAKVRKAIAKMIWLPSQFTGITTEGYATTTNWVTINSFVPMMILSIEGETTQEVEGWSTPELESYFNDIMMANYKFLTYGYYPEGSGYEGSGKNYQYNAMMAAYAKRGYNFFTHPNVQAYATQFLPSLMQPFGNYFTSYDTIGGSGLGPEWGEQRLHPNDIIGLKWAYPDDPSVDFVYRQYLETPYKATDGTKQTFLDVYEQKITPRSTYANAFLSLLMMPCDYSSEPFATASAAARQDFTFFGKERGLVITRSGFDENALALNFHVRQDMGGHTYGDRNSFTLSGLGRVWVRNPVGYVPETEWSSSVLVDGKGITIAPQDGRKARMPSRIAAFQDNALATFTMGDATYAYNTAWKWCAMCRPVGSDAGIGGWTPVEETWNDFRSPSNQIDDFYGNVPFVDYANWRYGGYTEGIHKQKVNDLSQAYRQAGLIRGEHPYALIVDDLHKMADTPNTEWQWIAQLPGDLTVVPHNEYTNPNLDPARDIVFKEPSTTGNRKLLVRILYAEGSQPSGLFEFQEFEGKLSGGLTAWRLTIRRIAERPRFRIMLYPFQDGQAIPEHSESPNGDVNLKWNNQLVDTIQFQTSTQTVGGIDVELTGIQISRSGNQNVIDTRNQAVPMDIRW